MTVAELIKKLLAFPDDMPVVCRGYEDGYDSAGDVIQKEIKQVDGSWYNGEFQDADDTFWEAQDKPFIAVVIR